MNQLFLWANVSLFDLDVLLANRLTGAVISAVAACLCISWMADMRHQPGAKRPWLNVVVVVTVAALCFSWAGYELLTLDLGLPLWTKNLAFVAFFCGHAHLLSARSRCPAVWVVALVLAAPLIVRRPEEVAADRLILELYRDTYLNETDPMRYLILKDLYEILEKAIDRCREAGVVAYQIVLKNS